MLLPEFKKHYGKLKFLIGGEWVDSRSTTIEPDVNPATGEVIAEFPQATQDGFVKHRVVLDYRSGILGRHPVQHFRDALLITASLRRDRDTAHRSRELEWPHVDLVFIVRVMQHAGRGIFFPDTNPVLSIQSCLVCTWWDDLPDTFPA